MGRRSTPTFNQLGTVLRKTERSATKLSAIEDAEEVIPSLTDYELVMVRHARDSLDTAVEYLRLLVNRGSTPDRGGLK